MKTGNLLRRTNQTKLTDDELLILDVLFDRSDTFDSLVKENYASWHNLTYSHTLETDLLRELIDKLIQDRVITSYTSDENQKVFYALTESGGKLWEVERVPDWERYCVDTSSPDENGNWIVSVESPSLTTAKAFIDCANDCSLYKFNQDDIRTTTRTQANISTIGWMTFATVCSIYVKADPLPKTNTTDWKQYERKRSWWRSLTELAKFQML